MALSYNRMWKLFINKKMSKTDLRKATCIAPNTNGHICETLDYGLGDILEYVKDHK